MGVFVGAVGLGLVDAVGWAAQPACADKRSRMPRQPRRNMRLAAWEKHTVQRFRMRLVIMSVRLS